MQIMQDRSEYDLMTNFVKFMQQTSSPLSEDDSSVCNCYLLQFTYLINSSKVKASVKTSIFSRPINASLQMFMPFTGMSFINDFLLQPMLHFNHPLLQFADIMDPFLSTAVLFSRFYNHRIQTSAVKVASSIKINYQVSHGIRH